MPDDTFARLLVRAPALSDAAAAQARLSRWLDDAEDSADAAALRRHFDQNELLSRLIASIAEASPFLWDLVRADSRRVLRFIESDPEAELSGLLARAAAGAASGGDDAAFMRLLRRTKADAALLIALCDLGGVWPVMRVTRALTDLADIAVAAAVRYLFLQAVEQGRCLSADPAQPEQDSGYIVLAMGKMGAGELNYSSDIDLIVFYDPERTRLADGIEPASFFVRLTRGLVKLLNERDGDGYVFRTDLRLRPDPASTQIAVSMPAALNYYESIGQNWERAAMIKARPCAGDLAAGGEFLAAIAPFIWRKYLDFAAVADVHAMKRQINAYRGHSELAVEGHNVKLGRGGIREIEFFVQTQQLIAGGRHPELRGRETLVTLDDLVQGGWIDEASRDDLGAAYLFLREVEHRLQMVADEQTHTLPADQDGVDAFARFLGYSGRDEFAGVLLGHMRTVQARYGTLFESAPAEIDDHGMTFPPDADDRQTLDILASMGFRAPLEASAHIRDWLAGRYRSTRPEVARTALSELVPLIVDHAARSENPDLALKMVDQFLFGLHGSGRLLSLLRQNTDLMSLLALVLGMAPRLADTLARYPQVMDAVIEPSFFGPLPDEAELLRRLSLSLDQASAYEDFLDRIRMFAQEHMFLIGSRILSGTISAEQAGDAFARLADVLVRALFDAVQKNFAEQHGYLPGQEVAIIACGKLGGREMTATSDLDLIVVYDYDGDQPQSDGERPLYASQYVARLIQRLIGALTAQTNYGVLYQVDMRLRPSGRAGPLATRLESFARYQQDEAWVWEHLALTRARVVAASPAFTARVKDAISGVLRQPRDIAAIAAEVVDMRQAIAQEKGDSDRWNLKYAAGGLVDIEFIVQYLQLVYAQSHPEILDTSTARALDKAWRAGLIPISEADVLRPAVRLYQDLTQVLRLCLAENFDPKTARKDLLKLLSRAADVPDFAALDATIHDMQVQVRASFSRILTGDAG